MPSHTHTPSSSSLVIKNHSNAESTAPLDLPHVHVRHHLCIPRPYSLQHISLVNKQGMAPISSPSPCLYTWTMSPQANHGSILPFSHSWGLQSPPFG
jgi:hypothetical protein